MSLDIDAEHAALRQCRTSELLERYSELWDEDSRSRHRTYLIRRILWKLQANAEGGLSERAMRRAEELADESEVRVTPPKKFTPDKNAVRVSGKVRDGRLPTPGTSIVRNYKGRQIEVRVGDHDFEYDGERYRTLSAIAKVVTGTHINGFRFFQLGDRGVEK